jgi:glycosyltransferase involved in cell wall biosynthesis
VTAALTDDALRTLHHGSHHRLLTEEPTPEAGDAALDAIIVPTARPAEALSHVMQVAATIDVPVLVLCSKQATAYHARKVANNYDTAAWTVDVDDSLARRLPGSEFDRLLRAEGFGSISDLSLKRNLGLALARGAKWKRVLFLDDDIIIEEPGSLGAVAGLLDRYRAVGLANDGFPDNSVVCHAFRDAGGDQGTFIGGGAMMVNPQTARSFFPNIYNEDWLFLLGTGVPFGAARSGRMVQRAFDPYANPARAVAEELGDVIAESLFWLLDVGREIDAATTGYWGDALFRRREFIVRVLGRTEDAKVRKSLAAALRRSSDIQAGLCRDLIEAWGRDLARWKKFLHRMPVSTGPEKFVANAGLADRIHRSKALDV